MADTRDTISQYSPSDWGSIIAILMTQTNLKQFSITAADMELLMSTGNGVRIELTNTGMHFRLVTPDECRVYVEEHPETTVFGTPNEPQTQH